MLFQKFLYAKQLAKIAQPVFGEIHAVKQLNGGYYGCVFLMETAKGRVIAKVYYRTGFMKLECTQLNLLRKYALTAVPEIYRTSEKAENGRFDVLFMEYINGVNGSALKNITAREKEALAEQITDNLLSIHAVKHASGFGELDASAFSPAWEPYYKAAVQSRMEALQSAKHVPKQVLQTAERLYEGFDTVFCEPVQEASLIHGDYNMWNLMFDPDTKQLIGMLDPMGCSFADSVLDLFQLDNANGKEFGLLDCYRKKAGLGEEIDVKNGYYGFFDDVKHWYLSGNLDTAHILNYGNTAVKYL